MTRALAGFRVIDTTHVLAGPFASYQMAVLGADVIKVEDPSDPDQARLQGSDRDLSSAGMGTAFMAQASNKKAVALNLKTESGRDALKRLIETADVFVENYRPGAFEALGLGYEELRERNPSLIYCSISAFGSTGPRREQTGYDSVLQAFSGMMAMTGSDDGDPLKCGAPVVDYATGTTAAYAITAALLQRERNGGSGQFVDVSMLDVALVLCSPYVTGYLWNGSHPKPKGNRFPFATIGQYRASDAELMIAASNLEQQRRLWIALGREDLIKQNNNQRLDSHAEEEAALSSIIVTMPADYWEHFFRERRIPAARVRQLKEALADPQIASRPLLHKHSAPGTSTDGLVVPVAGFTMSKSAPGLSFPPQPLGAQTEEILRGIGFGSADLERLRAEGAIN
ncbi:crotonobetainyl-CoA:carnitine CoA-transferase CaiB-like acyl-CoA transferase [Sinorhizobium kostiense]|uniref:Crotonobetainyl-CoA:carnitine CoA-transferase CaiB-like acyl-CoA transferase n=1 Tax=Sinorhizobium kostiense TaxID=76747 RepID=A0ABS4QY12_9HYPH|nr:CoA transferase [Sinorhizobium kostiense]MBP2235538.1 crotonobetainyl-CoA:carnitine CoA-transferase CaiB-like acyl-CoA transferase [Sinorhizobium kostiense]